MSGGAWRTDLLVVRHGQSTWNSESRFTGQVDVPLSELGQAQAEDLARRCAYLSIDAVITSDLKRANVTGRTVSEALGLPQPAQLSLLRERWSSTLQGLPRDEIEARYPGQLAAWAEAREIDLPGENEPYAQFADRVVRGLVSAARYGERVLVVAHAGVFVVLDQLAGTVGAGGVRNAAGRMVHVSGDDALLVGQDLDLADEHLRSGHRDP